MDRRSGVVVEAAESLRRVLALVEGGELDAPLAFVSQLRGAVAALEAVASVE